MHLTQNKLLQVAFLLATITAFGLAEPTSHTKIALLVGIDRYKSKNLPQLDGCVNDVEDIRQLLTTKYDFDDEDVKTLNNDKATHASIVFEFQRLIRRADRQTSVVFYFAGHGSQMPGGEKPDTYDETIVPYDSRTKDVFDISDREIAGLLSLLLKKAKDVTLVFDSCYSGTINRARGLGPRVRTAPRDFRDPPPDPPYALVGQGDKDHFVSARGIARPENDYVVLSSCRSNQLSNELDCAGKSRGIFTYYFSQCMRRAASRASFRDILEQVRADIATDIAGQQPCGEGKLDRVPFGGLSATSSPYFLINRSGTRFILQGGSVHGVTKGSRFDVFPPGTTEFRPENAIAKARITAVADFTADAEFEDKTIEVHDLARAVEREHAFPLRNFKVALQISDQNLEDQLKIAIEASNIVSVSDPAVCNLIVRQSAEQIQILDASGTLMFEKIKSPSSGTTTVPEIINKLVELEQWTSLLSITNPVSTFDAVFRVHRTGDPIPMDKDSMEDHICKSGDQIDISVVNRSEQGPYLTILDFSTDGSIRQIYPPAGAFQVLAPNRSWSSTTKVFLPSGYQHVRDHLKLFLTAKPIDFSPLLREGPKHTRSARGAALIQSDNTWGTFDQVFDVVADGN